MLPILLLQPIDGLFDGLTWRDVGVVGAIIIFIIIVRFDDLKKAISNLFATYASDIADRREADQKTKDQEIELKQNKWEFEAQKEATKESREWSISQQAIQLLQGQLDFCRTEFQSMLQAQQKLSVDIVELQHNISVIKEHMRQLWGVMAELKEALKDDKRRDI